MYTIKLVKKAYTRSLHPQKPDFEPTECLSWKQPSTAVYGAGSQCTFCSAAVTSSAMNFELSGVSSLHKAATKSNLQSSRECEPWVIRTHVSFSSYFCCLSNSGTSCDIAIVPRWKNVIMFVSAVSTAHLGDLIPVMSARLVCIRAVRQKGRAALLCALAPFYTEHMFRTKVSRDQCQ